MSRPLSRAERKLWEEVRRTVRPLAASGSAQAAEAKDELPGETALPPVPTAPAPVRARPSIAAPPPLAPLEDRLVRRLSRGLAQVDARIDLHGMRQEKAFRSLLSFLRHAQARGAKVALVVTGKGKAGEEGRGVLREMAPAWLARPDLRGVVLGFGEAGHRHGGAGALYVRLRRRRSERSS
jgi:DNA-nicking Smr family endonuclease